MPLERENTYANKDALALEVDVSDGELVGQRHFGDAGTESALSYRS